MTAGPPGLSLDRIKRAEQNFWPKVDKTGADCWIWTGGHTSSKAPTFGVGHRALSASKVAAFYIGGSWPEQITEPTCGTSRCLNPHHRRPRSFLPVRERWEQRVDRDGSPHPYVPALGNCWRWTGITLPNGYGVLRVKRVGVYAHRLSLEFAQGRPPELFVLHSCDRPWCVNPAHLREGTQADNVRDRDERGRGWWFGRKQS